MAALKVILGAVIGGLAFALLSLYMTYFYPPFPIDYNTAIQMQTEITAVGTVVGAIAGLAQAVAAAIRGETKKRN